MVQWTAAGQLVLVAGVFAAAGTFKVFGRTAPVAARRSALKRLAGEDRVTAVFRLVGAIELGLAVALPFAVPIAPAAAAVWSLGMLGYLGYAKVSAPDSSCGCMSAKEAPISWRAFARAGLLVVASVAGTFAGTTWVAALAERPVPTLGLVAVEAALVVVLSAELDHRWLIPLRRFRATVRHPLRGTASRDVPVQASLQQLVRSPAYRSVHDLIVSALLDHWDEGEWRMVTFSARHEGGHAVAVFAVPRLADEPERVRVALVGDTAVPEPVSTPS